MHQSKSFKVGHTRALCISVVVVVFKLQRSVSSLFASMSSCNNLQVKEAEPWDPRAGVFLVGS